MRFSQRVSKIKSRRYFYRIFVFYIILITIPAIFISEFIYVNLKGEWKKEINENCNNLVIQTASSLNVVFSQVMYLTKTLSSDPSINDLMTFPDKNYYESVEWPSEVQDLNTYFNYMILRQKVLNKLIYEKYNNEFIDDIFLYDTQTNHTYSSDIGLYKPFGQIVNESGFENIIKRNTGISIVKREVAVDKSSKRDIFSLISRTNSNSGVVIININIDRIYDKIFSQIMEKEGTIYLIMDDRNNIILKSRVLLGSTNSELDEKLKVDGYLSKGLKSSDCIIKSKELNINNWVLVGIRTLKDFNQKTKRAVLFFILIIVVSIVSFIMIALWVSVKLYSPIKNIKNQVMNYSPNTATFDDMENIFGGLKSLITSRNDFYNKIKEYTPLVRESIIRNVIMNDMYQNIVEPDQNITGENLGFKIEGPFAVATIEINKGLTDSFMKEIVSICRKIVDGLGYVLPDNSNNIILLFNMNDSGYEEIVQEKLNNIIKATNEKLRFDCIAVLGKTCRTIKQIGDSFKEVRSFLQFKLIYGYDNSLILMDKVETLPEEIHNQIEDAAHKLACSIKTGKYIESCRNFDNVLGMMASPDRCFHIMSHLQIFIDIISNIIRELNTIGIECNKYFFAEKSIYYEFMGLHDREELITWFHNIINKSCELVMEQNGNKLVYMEKIKEYINENITRDISLQDIANHVGLNTAYISKIFKDWTDANISDYISIQKIEKAKYLLSEKRMKVKEVSRYLGYAYDAYFIMTFKKNVGVTPNQFKKESL